MKNSTLEQRILDRLSQPKYRPLSRSDLAKAIRLHSSERNKLRKTLLDLERKGKLVCLRKNRWALAGDLRRVSGTVRVMETSFGLFTPADGGDKI